MEERCEEGGLGGEDTGTDGGAEEVYCGGCLEGVEEVAHHLLGGRCVGVGRGGWGHHGSWGRALAEAFASREYGPEAHDQSNQRYSACYSH